MTWRFTLGIASGRLMPAARAAGAALVQVHPVSLDRVVAGDLALDGLADMGEVLGDYFLRMRPGGVGVGKVGGPHKPVLAKVTGGQRSHRIVLERCPQLAAQVFAGQ